MSAVRKLNASDLNSREQRDFLISKLGNMTSTQKKKAFVSMPNIAQLMNLVSESLLDEKNGDLKAILHNHRLIENIKIGLFQSLT